MKLHELLRSVEGPEFEAKAAQGGLPRDLWETYSAFANTGGGIIVLGLKEQGDGFLPLGVQSPAKLRKNLFDCLNDRAKVSANLLREGDVTEVEVDGRKLIVIRVQEAPRRLKPVYINGDPGRGTFRRLGGSDYRCGEDDMRRMWAETADARDGRILRGFILDDLDAHSLSAYRNLLRTASPGHIWLAGDDRELLMNLGGWRHDREAGEEGLTLAGLLMFGHERPILDALPHYQVDYREVDPADPAVRWTYRHTVDGNWSPNLFEFFYRTIQRLTRDLAIPFRLQNLQRIDDSNVAAALREALVNALIHADHEGHGGIVVIRQPHLFLFENPGDIRVPVEQALAGGVSDCRNPSLQKMFRLIGLGEQAGSGLPRLQQAWKEQMWRAPSLTENQELYRTSLLLSTSSLLPDDALRLLSELYGEETYARLSTDAVLATVTAHLEGQVTRGRLATMTASHPADITALLRQMAADGLLVASQPRRGVFVLPQIASPARKANSPSLSGANPSLSETNPSPQNAGSASHEGGTAGAWDAAGGRTDEQLQRMAAPAAQKGRLSPDVLRPIIVDLCRVRPLRLTEIAALLNRKPESLRQHHITPLLAERRLQYLYIGEPAHPRQAYVATNADEGHGRE